MLAPFARKLNETPVLLRIQNRPPLIPSPVGTTSDPYHRAVNPNRDEVLGIKSYITIRDVPQAIDLVVVATPTCRRCELF